MLISVSYSFPSLHLYLFILLNCHLLSVSSSQWHLFIVIIQFNHFLIFQTNAHVTSSHSQPNTHINLRISSFIHFLLSVCLYLSYSAAIYSPVRLFTFTIQLTHLIFTWVIVRHQCWVFPRQLSSPMLLTCLVLTLNTPSMFLLLIVVLQFRK